MKFKKTIENIQRARAVMYAQIEAVNTVERKAQPIPSFDKNDPEMATSQLLDAAVCDQLQNAADTLRHLAEIEAQVRASFGAAKPTEHRRKSLILDGEAVLVAVDSTPADAGPKSTG